MKNIALILAGGSGHRMMQEIPKQFLNVKDKPVIMYTLEAFQSHPSIDTIVIACIDGWEHILCAYCRQYGITKLEKVVVGGLNGQDSIRNSIEYIATRHGDDDMVLIHDAIRPMVSKDIISDCIRVATKYGTAISAIPCTEAMLKTSDGERSSEQIPRSELRRTQTPQAATVKHLVEAHKKALEVGITNSVATCTLLIELGEEVHFSLGSEKNIKLTTPDDLEIFKALLAVRA